MTSEQTGQNGSDVFISYSHDDSREIVKLLVGELQAMGLDVWYDDIEMSLGDSIRDSIDKGLQTSNYGVVVLSEGYFEGMSEWELNGLVQKHTEEDGVILPLWHGVDHDYVYNQSASLADLKAESISEENVQSVATTVYITSLTTVTMIPSGAMRRTTAPRSRISISGSRGTSTSTLAVR